MKFNYKRDALLGFIGMAIMLLSSIYSFANNLEKKGILLICLAGVMFAFGLFCLIKLNSKGNKNNNSKK